LKEQGDAAFEENDRFALKTQGDAAFEENDYAAALALYTKVYTFSIYTSSLVLMCILLLMNLSLA
jgi:hypothetical protein